MGVFNFLRGKDERAIPEPGTPEFEAAVNGTALPGSVDMGQSGWTSTSLGPGPGTEGESHTIDLRGTGAREDVEKVLREHGIDPDEEAQTIDAGTVPGLQQAILAALGASGLKIPDAGGFGGGISAPQADPLAQIEHLAAKQDAGEISEAEFEAHKRRLLGS
jgi:hypothetical protein